MQRCKGFVCGMLAMAFAVYVTACGSSQDQLVGVTVINITSSSGQGGTIHLSKDANCSNHSTTLTAQVLGIPNSNAPGHWTSSNASVAAVDPSTGHVTAVSPGTATITFTSSDGHTFANITVVVDDTSCTTTNPGGSGGSISLSPPGGSFAVGSTTPVTITCKDASGNTVACSNTTLTSGNTTVVQIPDIGHIFCAAQGGPVTVTVTATVNGATVSNSYSFTCTQSTQNTFTITGPGTISSGQGCTNTAQLIYNMNGSPYTGSVLWSSSNLNVSVNGSGLVTALNGATGQVTITASGGGSSATTTLTISSTSCTTGGNGTITVTPNPLNITFPNVGTLTATLGGGLTGTPTWAPTLGCVQLQSTTGMQVNVNSTRAGCRDSVVAFIGNVKGFAIVNVASASSGCTISGPTSIVINVNNQLNGNCGTQQNYWYSSDPSRVTVVGAPYVCMVGTTAWPCGPNATIKGIAVGQADVCTQPAVADNTTKACQRETVTATSSGNLIPSDGPRSFELDIKQLKIKWGTEPKSAGVQFDRVIPMEQYIQMVRQGKIAPSKSK